MELPLVVTPESEIPIYLQIKYQIAYLINSRKLREGRRLPAVHQLAKQLNINAGTVSQAYRELQRAKLVKSEHGKGTFVQALDGSDPESYYTRHAILLEELENAVRRGRSLGFGNAEIQHALSSILSKGHIPLTAILVGYNAPIAERYARIIESHFGRETVQVIPLALACFEELSSETRKLLNSVYYVITLSRMVYRVEEILKGESRSWRVLGISTEISAQSFEALAQLSPNVNACLVVQERVLHSALAQIQMHSELEVPLPYALDTEPDAVRRVVNDADVVIHTYPSRQVLDEIGVPEEERLELLFEINADSLTKLEHVFEIQGQTLSAR